MIDELTPNHREYFSMMDKPEVIDIDLNDIIKNARSEVRDFDAVFLGCPPLRY